MGDLVVFNGPTRLDLPPDRVLHAALGNLQSVVIAGYDKDGNEYFASSLSDTAKTLWLLERCKRMLLETPDLPQAEGGSTA